MKTYFIDRFGQINPERMKWNELAERSASSAVFQTFEWHRAWWDVFGDEHDLCVIVAQEGSEVVGIAPFMVTTQEGRFGRRRVVEFIGSGSSDYCDFLTNGRAQGAIPAMLNHLFEHRDRWDCLKLTGIQEDSMSSKMLMEACRKHNSGKFFVRYSDSHKLVIKNCGNDIKQVLRKKSLKRRQKYFKRQGHYEVDHLFDPAEIEKQLNLFFEQHISRWSSSRTPSLFLREKSRLFFEKLVENLSTHKWMLFTVVRSAGIPLAFHFGFYFKGILTWYTPSFNQAYSKYSPGQVLLKELLDYAVQERMDAFDFTVGSEEYKKRFSNKIGRVQSFHIFNHYLDYEFERMGRLFRKVVRLVF